MKIDDSTWSIVKIHAFYHETPWMSMYILWTFILNFDWVFSLAVAEAGISISRISSEGSLFPLLARGLE